VEGRANRAAKRLGSAYRATTLKKYTNPIHLVDWEVYSITHTLFYVTSFSGTLINFSQKERGSAITLVETLLVNFWRKSDWDITGELLLNLVGLERSSDFLFLICSQAFLNVWRDDGAVPGPTFLSAYHGGKQKDIFEHCYHTTLVGLLLSEAFLYRQREGTTP
jgi:hypothetical protein